MPTLTYSGSRRSADPDAGPASEDAPKTLVGCYVGEVHYALPIEAVSEITRPLRVLPLPQASNDVIGVADHRGHVLPVIDLRLRFGMRARMDRSSARWVIVKVDSGLAGLLVDSVTEVFAAGEPQQRRAPELGSGEAARAITAVYKHRDRLTFVLDIPRTTAPLEALDLEQLPQVLPESP